jgi:[ribosomal protein S18]-alanine N-acetyltransferase
MPPSHTPSLRPPRPDDYDALASWIPDARTSLWWAGPKLKFPFKASQLAGLLAEPAAVSRVLERHATGDLLGFGQYWPREEGAAHLARILVAPEHRGQGLGESLCRLLMADAQSSLGAHTFTLRVSRDNCVAIPIYLSLDFNEVPELSDGRVMFMRRRS